MKDTVISIRINDVLKQKILERAKEENKTLSQYCLDLINEKLKENDIPKQEYVFSLFEKYNADKLLAEQFYNYYSSINFKMKGERIKNLEGLVKNWIIKSEKMKKYPYNKYITKEKHNIEDYNIYGEID